jgi:hypothetical protein
VDIWTVTPKDTLNSVLPSGIQRPIARTFSSKKEADDYAEFLGDSYRVSNHTVGIELGKKMMENRH